jgi:hypothetical protein
MAYPTGYSARMILMKILSWLLQPVPSPNTGKAGKRSSPSRSRPTWIFSPIFMVFHQFSSFFTLFHLQPKHNLLHFIYLQKNLSAAPSSRKFCGSNPAVESGRRKELAAQHLHHSSDEIPSCRTGSLGFAPPGLGAARLHVKPESGARRELGARTRR